MKIKIANVIWYGSLVLFFLTIVIGLPIIEIVQDRSCWSGLIIGIIGLIMWAATTLDEEEVDNG